MAENVNGKAAPASLMGILSRLEKIEPPPMRVVRKGWLRTTVTERSLADLEREDAIRAHPDVQPV